MNKKTNPLLVILSILIPIIGYVLYFVYKDEDQKIADSYLWPAIGGTIVAIFLIF